MDMFMRDSDAFSWRLEDDPVIRSTVVAVAWLEHSPDWEALVRRVGLASSRIPMLRQKVVESSGLMTPPRWVDDTGFDLSWHLTRMDAPAPRTDRTVVDVARRLAMTGFDRSRPLWEFVLVNRVEGGRAALVMKIHHSLTDGLGAMQLGLLLFDTVGATEPDGAGTLDAGAGAGAGASDDGARPAEPARRRPAPFEGGARSLAFGWGRAAGLARAGARSGPPLALRAARSPAGFVSEALATARSIGRTVAPVTSTMSPLMTGRGLSRHLDLVEVSLDDLKRAAAAAGGTVNDGFMAAVTGGLDRYHRRHGAEVNELRVTLPISIRTEDDPVGGNRITLMRFPVPVGEPDPKARMAEIGRRCRAARHERSLPHTNAIAAALNLMPLGFVAAMIRNIDFVASDVPGFPFAVRLCGVEVERLASFGPTTGTAANMTLVSYNGATAVGVTADTSAIPDPEVLVDCLAEAFEEVLDLGGDHEAVRLPLRVRSNARPPAGAVVGSHRGARRRPA